MAKYSDAVRIGGNAWERTGQIWYRALCDKLRPTSNFSDAARLTLAAARELYGAASPEQKAIRAAWSAVGIST